VPDRFERSVTAEASKSVKTWGKRFTLTGSLRSEAGAPSACTSFVDQLELLRAVHAPAVQGQCLAAADRGRQCAAAGAALAVARAQVPAATIEFRGAFRQRFLHAVGARRQGSRLGAGRDTVEGCER
jgi:hypothetical protein